MSTVLPSAPLTWRDELRATLRLAVPVATVEVGMMLMGVVDTMMVGHLSADALAAVALGNLYVWAVCIFGMGVLMALDPIVSQAVGAGDPVAIARGVQRGLLLTLPLALVSSLLLVPGEAVLGFLRQPAGIIPDAARYARANIAGMLPWFAFIVLRQTLQAKRQVAPIVLAVVAANLVNVLLNWMLVYGRLGAPALGAVGTGWATSASRGVLALAVLVLARRELMGHILPVRRDALALAPLGRMVALGAPIGVQHQVEYGAFAVIALMMGWLGPREMAGHQVALNLAALTFMVPLGISAAGAVLVGHAVGKGDPLEARRAAGAALVCGASFMAASAAVMLAAPGFLARLYTADPQVLAVAGALIPLAGLFQVFDGTQVVAIGILRGTGDTRTPMVVAVLGFWLVGMPVSAWLGFRTAAGPRGLWWGLVVGLLAVSMILLARVRLRLRREMRRVVIDDAPAAVPSAGP